jgi:hypothetical protein
MHDVAILCAPPYSTQVTPGSNHRTPPEGVRTTVLARVRALILSISIGIVVTPSVVHTQTTPPVPTPQEVTVGIYVNQITDFSLAEESVRVDLYLWFRWDPTQPSPDGTNPDERFELIGASEMEQQVIVQREGYVVLRIRATIKEPWDVTNFPLDNHVVRIHVEDAALESHLIIMVPDSTNTAVGPNVAVAGWRVGAPVISATTADYASNFGDITLPTGNSSTYSRITLDVPLNRDGNGGLLKVVAGLFISVCVCLVVFWVPATDVDPRFGLSVGSLFAAVASQYVVASALPATATWTLSDRLHLAGFVVILIAIAQSALALHLLTRHGNRGYLLTQRIDRIFFLLLLTGWLTTSGYLIASV